MKTFCIQTLGCKVNQYESEQMIALLRARGLIETTPEKAELRIINSCSVTVQAASQSRQATRRMARLPVLSDPTTHQTQAHAIATVRRASQSCAGEHPPIEASNDPPARPRVLVMGCWATSDKSTAQSLAGVDAVLTHHDNIADEVDRLLVRWGTPQDAPHASESTTSARAFEPPREAIDNSGWMMKAGPAANDCTTENRPELRENVNQISEMGQPSPARISRLPGANSLPLLGEHQTGRQRAFLKVQDGCDAHCTYCIIPQLRPALFSKPIDDAVEEARRLVGSGHVELVLTGIFLGAYGQPTALRRRQPDGAAPLADLVRTLCTKVPGLRRLRLSSLEPGDLTEALLAELTSHEQVVAHFHLPLQSGSDEILRRMNRQYRRDDFLRMVERVNAAFDQPALTTDVIAGFPGETDAEFSRTVEIVERSRFIHIHAFPYSSRPGTAASRWSHRFIHGPVVNQRIDHLRRLADEYSHQFRSGFVGRTVNVIVESGESAVHGGFRHGRCERYFAVHFDGPQARPGDIVPVRIERVTPSRTFGVIDDVGAFSP